LVDDKYYVRLEGSKFKQIRYIIMLRISYSTCIFAYGKNDKK